jgi:myo-inositol-1(or 4)-monophosphatase
MGVAVNRMETKRIIPPLDVLLDCAVLAARAAGDHARRHSARRTERHAETAHDVKLVLDRESQLRAAEAIHSRYPDHPILGEEISHDRDPEQPRWIVDPIDGTVNFSHGWPLWCTAVAVEHGGRTLAGAVYAPELDELYTARAGEPALLNGRPLAVSSIDRLADALIQTDTNKEPFDFPVGAALYGALLNRAQKTRVTGSAALDICRVARGCAEGYTALGIYPWDTAAAALILEQSGGRFEVIEQLDHGRFRAVASNGRVHEELKAVFMETLAAAGL